MLDSKKMLIIGIITTLVLGFVLGIVADRAVSFGRYGPKYWKWMEKKDDRAKEIIQEKLLHRLTRKLDLNQAQIQTIGGILRIQSQQIMEERRHHFKKMQLIMKETTEKIKTHLTPDQQQRFEKIITTHRKRWQKFAHKKQQSCR